MAERAKSEQELKAYLTRHRTQRMQLEDARASVAKANKLAAYWLDECMITQRKILALENRMKSED